MWTVPSRPLAGQSVRLVLSGPGSGIELVPSGPSGDAVFRGVRAHHEHAGILSGRSGTARQVNAVTIFGLAAGESCVRWTQSRWVASSSSGALFLASPPNLYSSGPGAA